MLRNLKYLAFLILISCNLNASESAPNQLEAFPISTINENILFIGNSFTFYWNLPSQVEKMSIEIGLNWKVKHISIPSATLQIHWNNQDLKSLLESEKFDHIIIQEHSSTPLENQDLTKTYFEKIMSLIPESTQVHFFSTWMYPSIQYLNVKNDEFPIEKNIQEIIKGYDVKIIPVGRAFKLFNEKYPFFKLLMEDDKHPNSNGSYLASCIIFSHISGKSSVNLSKRYEGFDSKGVGIYYSIVEDEVLSSLQEISDEVIFL